MRTYVITGGTTGIGSAVREQLREQGHEVLNIDYKDGDILADLSTPEGRRAAIRAVFEKYPDGIDVLICNAGVGPMAPPKAIFSLDFFASVQIAEGLRPLLKKKKGNCVVTSSNSITNMTVRVDMLSNVMDEDRIAELVETIPQKLSSSCYSSAKRALARWVRRVSPSWGVDGMRINAVAPGSTSTPITQNMTEAQEEASLMIPIPTRYGTRSRLSASEIANGILFLASPQASGVNGVVLFVDGGVAALLRSEQI